MLYSIQKLTAVLKRIEDNLIKDDEKLENNSNNSNKVKIYCYYCFTCIIFFFNSRNI